MDSISQACFLKVPKKSKKNHSDPFACVTKLPVYQSYENVWRTLQNKLQNVYEEVSKKFVTDITNYIKTRRHPAEIIPALTLLTGTNFSDHNDLFHLIKQEIKSDIKCPVVFIQPFHHKSVKFMIESMVQNFMSMEENPTESDIDDDNDNEDTTKKQKKSKCTLSRLQQWHRVMEVDEGDHIPLVLIIPNVESFPSKLLDAFLNNLSVYKNHVPFIVILGIATNLNALHQRVSQPVLQNFDFSLFKPEPSLKFLDTVLEKIFLNASCPFQLHGNVLDMLINNFTYYNFSVKSFTRGIQFCVMNHFFESETSILCCSVDRIPKVIKSLNEDQIASLLKLRSVGELNTARKSKGQPILEKSKNVEAEIKEYMEALHDRLFKFHLNVRCFYVIVTSLPSSHYRKSMLEIYCVAMKDNITKSNEFSQCMKQFKLLSVAEIVKRINSIEEILLPHAEDDQIGKVLERLKKFQGELENFENPDEPSSAKKTKITPSKSPIEEMCFVKTPTKEDMNSPGKTQMSPSQDLIMKLATTVSKEQMIMKTPQSSRGDFMKNLKVSASTKRTASPWEQVKDDLVQFLDETFEIFLECPTKYPFHEVLLYKDVEYVKKKYTSINQLSDVNRVLHNPCSILRCKCCKLKNDDDFPETLPDLSISYKLFAEFGKDINLHDWLHSFNAKINGMENEEIDEEVYNRFMQTVKELQLMGFITPHRRKIDHVRKIDQVRRIK